MSDVRGGHRTANTKAAEDHPLMTSFRISIAMSTLERKYNVPSTLSEPGGSDELHVWSIYRQNRNSDYAEKALRTPGKTPPFGDFRLENRVANSILNHPRYGPRERRDTFGPNYLEFGLPRVSVRKEGSSGYDSSDDGYYQLGRGGRTRSDPDFHNHIIRDPAGRRARSQMDLTHLKDDRIIEPMEPPEQMNLMKQPYLQVQNLCFEVDKSSLVDRLCGGARTKLRILDNVSFEVSSGDVLAIMAAEADEGTAILDILANRHRKWLARVRGDLIMNGLNVSPKQLSACVAHVPAELAFSRDMSVRQTLLFTSLLQEPKIGGANKDRINAVLEDLQLGELMHTHMKKLNEAELRKVSVAYIVLLDQPLRGLDMCDMFTLMEYLREWACRGRIVILTMHPATYEIFSMASKVLLLSSGKVLYSGPRNHFVSYFTYNQFPCPVFKNPADYYSKFYSCAVEPRHERAAAVDLVTVDTLSAESMVESTKRVESFVKLYRNKPNPLSEPSPPGIIPSTIKRAGFFRQLMALWIRMLIYQFPYNIIGLGQSLVVVGLLSTLVGAIFWNVRGGREQAHVLDRAGLFHVATVVAIWPLVYMAITDESNKLVPSPQHIRAAYVISKLICAIPAAAIVYLAYVMPMLVMAGSSTALRIDVGVLLLYLIALRLGAMAAAWSCKGRASAATLATFAFCLITAVAGYVTHIGDQWAVTSALHLISPSRWAAEFLMHRDFHTPQGLEPRYYCSQNPVLSGGNQAVVRRATCGFQHDSEVLSFFDYISNDPLITSVLVSGSTLAGFFVIALICGLLARQR
ncbi:hypothetical protein LAZ67_X004077 [Cordylochernes scorpioides]|uniref:ABC transporter domain-containing protein n=1 Tax=Cordylochernes scorpioides TaxID=51811 RepID=A0ABY6LXX8_9ARAC|nr:hypothetical protein LAZ67_X004077 [Cordylochernes scorpioides]